ncbi:MAG: DNA/RNA non-specific endonuclease [Pyrinomonadaceae bacterium]|nr:DNA/RNA non-specific endonuclease [Pyrinomonadaceae bacterium]
MKNKIIAVLSAVVFVCVFSVFAQAQNTLSEGFEAGGKTAYAAANVTLGSGSWNLDEALTGNSASDRKTGLWSARVRNTGKVTMNFNVASAGTVTIQHGVYGSDGSSTWELWQSANSGASWAKVGSTVTTSSTSLATASFTVNTSAAVRFEIRKISGGTNRINLDNITATTYGGGGGGSSSVHLTMGNPSNAVTNISSPTNYLMEKPQYALSYHNGNNIPNWVSWHLDSSWLGSTPRQDDFRADTSLPAGWYQVGSTSYSGSGYDRGHMCPSADRTASVADNSATFLMTNMIPQAPTNNQVTWANLENYSRSLVTAGNELYIISGGQGVSGYINNGNVAVPTNTWKVIIVLPAGTNDVSRVTSATRTIAVFMPNNNSVVSDWKQYRVSVDYVESMTGYDFFSNVGDTVENQIESVVDTQ